MTDSVEYEYDELGRLTKLTFSNGDTVEYRYDEMGNRQEVEVVILPP